MNFENILAENDDGILMLTINRPDKMNALNKKTVQEISQAFDEVYSDPGIRAVIITGSGPKAFVAGADISEFEGLSNEEAKALSAMGQSVFNKIENCPKPVIAAVNGFALGGGCELSMACHIRIASDNARFGQPEVKLGLIPGYGGTQRLVQLIGKGKALELLMSAEMIDSATALNLGLVNYITSPEELQAKCRELLGKIMQNSPYGVKKVIECVNANFEDGVDGYKKEIDAFGVCFGTEDFVEGTGAFNQKRKASFKPLSN